MHWSTARAERGRGRGKIRWEKVTRYCEAIWIGDGLEGRWSRQKTEQTEKNGGLYAVRGVPNNTKHLLYYTGLLVPADLLSTRSLFVAQVWFDGVEIWMHISLSAHVFLSFYSRHFLHSARAAPFLSWPSTQTLPPSWVIVSRRGRAGRYDFSDRQNNYDRSVFFVSMLWK